MITQQMINRVFSELATAASTNVKRISEQNISNKNTDLLANDVLKSHKLLPFEIDKSFQPQIVSDSLKPADTPGRSVQAYPYKVVEFAQYTVRFLSGIDMISDLLTAKRFQANRVIAIHGAIRLLYYVGADITGNDAAIEAAKTAFKQDLNLINEFRDHVNPIVEDINSKLLEYIKGEIEERKENIRKKNDTISKLDLDL